MIKFETSILAKEKGFDEPVLYYYDGSEMVATQSQNPFDFKNYNRSKGSTLSSIPTQSVLKKWLETKLNCIITPHPVFGKKGGYDSFNLIGFHCTVVFNKENLYPLFYIDYSVFPKNFLEENEKLEDINYHIFGTEEESLENTLISLLKTI